MIFLGVGESLGVVFNGILQDKLGNKVAIYINLIELCAAYVTLIYYVTQSEFNLTFACIVNFIFGVQDAGVNNFLCCICAFQFES